MASFNPRAPSDRFGRPLPVNEEEENVIRVYSADVFQDLVVSSVQAEKEKQKEAAKRKKLISPHSASATMSQSLSQASQSLIGDLSYRSGGGTIGAESRGSDVGGGSRAGVSTSQSLMSGMSNASNYSAEAVAAAAAACKSPHGRSRKPTEEEIRKQELRIRKREQLMAVFKAYELASKDREKRLKEAIRKRAQLEEHKFKQQRADLEATRPHADAMARFIAEHDERERRKQQTLFAEWEQHVFKPVQEQIQAKLGEMSSSEIARRRMALFQEFIDQTNQKDGLFRDIIIESEYNPLKAHAHTIHYNAAKLHDPCKQDLMKAREEKSLMNQNLEVAPPPILNFTGPSPAAPIPAFAASHKVASAASSSAHVTSSASVARGPRSLAASGLRPRVSDDDRCPGRDTMDVKIWDKAHATPYGHFAGKFDADGELLPLEQRPNPGQTSRVVFDHFNIDKDPAQAEKEFKAMRTKGF